MIGLISGFGTRAGTLVYNKFIESWTAKVDEDWPEIMVMNVAPKFDKYATLTTDVIVKLQESANILKDAGCTKIFVACNTVHAQFDLWANDCCVDWTESFQNTIPVGFLRIGSKTSSAHDMYGCETGVTITKLIECYIGSKTRQSTSMAQEAWDAILRRNLNIALCCTELSLAYKEFGAYGGQTIIDCADHIVKRMVDAAKNS